MAENSRPTTIHFTNNPDNDGIRLVSGTNVHHDFPCHIHHSYSLGIVIRGERIIQVNDAKYSLSTGDCFIINPHEPHSCCIPVGVDHDYRIISVNSQMLRSVNRRVLQQDWFPHFSCVKICDKDLANEFTSLLELHQTTDQFTEELFLSIIERLVTEYADKGRPLKVNENRHTLVTLACAYIEENIGRVIRLDELAKVVNISPYYLDRIFREEIGVPPYTYLLQTRIKRSMDILLEADSVAEAALRLGFSDQSHFSRFFKRNVGLSPKQFCVQHKIKTH